ncbi:adenine phosphoribosyltransferase [Prochlorococcus sp. MIT 1011]|uniref:adenine phosphoribosyltransferase n=1 Tax=Prochlorococcus sp. MIT 1011 TaxID=3082520 RepID=UPI0039B68C31
MNNASLEYLIETYEDFPKEDILFRDVLPILRNPEKFSSLIQEMSELEICKAADAILAIDARGFLFGSSLALKSFKPLVVARKPGKLPGKIITNKYSLEYGTNSLSIQEDSIKDYKSFLIVDDLLATGGTVESVSKLLYSQDKKITGLSIVIELSELNGREKFDFPVISKIMY